MIKSKEEMQKDEQDAIKWGPLLSAAEIGVTVKDGVVRLRGSVDNYLKKPEAEDVAKTEHTATHTGKGESQYQKKEAVRIPWIADNKLVVSLSDN